MPIVASAAVDDTVRAHFRLVPWHADHPDRLDLGRRLPPDDLARSIDAAVDGTLVAANASRHQLLNEATLEQRSGQLAQAIAADAAGTVPPASPGWMAKTVVGRSRQQRRYRKAQQQLQAAQARNAQKRA